CAASGDQLRGRLRESTGAADDGDTHQEGKEGALHPAADHRSAARTWHAPAPGGVGRTAGRIPRHGAEMKARVAVVLAATLGTAMSVTQPAQPKTMAPVAARRKPQTVRPYPPDRTAFTQGLVYEGGRLYESTGLVGRSSLREVELETGRVIRKVDVAPPIFAEGLALAGDRLIQLTWQNGIALLYDRATFARQGELTYRGEGWGLCRDSESLVMSDGSATLTIRRPKD